MRKIVLQEQDIKDFESKLNALPCFAKNLGENMAISGAIQDFMNFMGSKLIETTEEEDPNKPIGGGGGAPLPINPTPTIPPNEEVS